MRSTLAEFLQTESPKAVNIPQSQLGDAPKGFDLVKHHCYGIQKHGSRLIRRPCVYHVSFFCNSEFWNLKRAICGTFEKPWCWCTWISCGRAMTPRGNLVFRYSETMISELKLWKKNIRFCVFQSRSPRLIFDDDVNLLCQWNGTCDMLFVQPIQKVNLGNTTFISYRVNMFLHGHRKILSYIKLGRHFFPTFQDHKAPGNSLRMLLRSVVVPPHKTLNMGYIKLWTCVEYVPKQSIP